MMYAIFFKRLFDLLIALAGFIILLPIFCTITVCLFIANSGKPFFFQIRPGRYGNLFKIIKFKTMNDKVGLDGVLLPDVLRLTKFGSFVRKTSLDELPQLLNVVKGDMSLIGPRPLLVEYLLLYSKIQSRRHEVRPGITGWAQVNGRNTIDWSQKFAYDVWYVDHVSATLDLKIIGLTILKVLKSDGISAEGEATMSRFKGDL